MPEGDTREHQAGTHARLLAHEKQCAERQEAEVRHRDQIWGSVNELKTWRLWLLGAALVPALLIGIQAARVQSQVTHNDETAAEHAKKPAHHDAELKQADHEHRIAAVEDDIEEIRKAVKALPKAVVAELRRPIDPNR